MFGNLLPRHLQIIYEINHRFLDHVYRKYPGDLDRLSRMSIIEEHGGKKIRMAHLAIVGSHSVNGVSALHSQILTDSLFRDFYELWPEKFNNKTNGITQRRWLRACNPDLSALITSRIGDDWIRDLDELKKLVPLAGDNEFRAEWTAVKRRNKELMSEYIMNENGIMVDPDSMFDCQVKRIHEYKRQLLNILHVITLYNRLRDNPNNDTAPRTVIFAGKAAPGYYMAKKIIQLINSVADVINRDPAIKK